MTLYSESVPLEALRSSLRSCESFTTYCQEMLDNLPAGSLERPFAERTLRAARKQTETRLLAVLAAERVA
jgi:hypothetical protein